MKTEIISKTTSILLILIAIVFSTNVLMAQKKGHKKPPPIPDQEQIERMMTELSAKLSLTEKQEKQIHELYEAHFKEVSEMMGEKKNPGKEGHEKMKKLREIFEADVKSFLTLEQQKKFDEFVKERHQKRSKKPNHKRDK